MLDKKQQIEPISVMLMPINIIGFLPYLSERGPYTRVPAAIANIERLKVSCATSLVTEKVSFITGKAGSSICIATGPRAETAASNIIMRFESESIFDKSNVLATSFRYILLSRNLA